MSTLGVQLAIAHQALAEGSPQLAQTVIAEILADDPWQWRALWIQGLIALAARSPEAVELFNTVYGEIPGELAPKLALARACELAGQPDVATRLYAVCARTDATYIAPAQFGLARLAQQRNEIDTALAALDRIPASSRSWGEARRQRAVLLAMPDGGGRFDVGRLATAMDELDRAGVPEQERLRQRLAILTAALSVVESPAGPGSPAAPGSGAPGPAIGGVALDPRSVRLALEQTYRDLAMWEEQRSARIALVDAANAIRPRTLT